MASSTQPLADASAVSIRLKSIVGGIGKVYLKTPVRLALRAGAPASRHRADRAPLPGGAPSPDQRCALVCSRLK